MLALVTGSTGFIGAHLCRALLQRGWAVRAFHRAGSPLALLNDLPVEHVVGDLTQPHSLLPALADVDVLFHAAAALGGAGGMQHMQAVTVQGTRSLLQAALQAGVRRVVHTSSVAALGVPDAASRRAGTSPALMDEHHTWNYYPRAWPYAYCKYLAELEVQRAAAQGLDVVVVNPSLVYGAGDIHRLRNSLILQVAHRRAPVVPAGGANAVHIDDVIDGHLAALEHGRSGERYILGGENLTHANLVQRIAAATGVSPPRLVLPGGAVRALAAPLGWLAERLGLPLSAQELRMAGWYFYYDSRKAREELHLPAPRPVDEALAQAYQWFLRQASAA